MRRKHRRTLADVFKRPILSGICWQDMEDLLLACGAHVEERAGSRIAIELNDVVAIFHRSHPGNVADKGSVASMRNFLAKAEIYPIHQEITEDRRT